MLATHGKWCGAVTWPPDHRIVHSALSNEQPRSNYSLKRTTEGRLRYYHAHTAAAALPKR